MAQRIVIDPQVRFGKPCVAGTRVSVQDVLELVRDGISFEVIQHDFYPDITTEDIQQCVDYAIRLIALEEISLANLA